MENVGKTYNQMKTFIKAAEVAAAAEAGVAEAAEAAEAGTNEEKVL